MATYFVFFNFSRTKIIWWLDNPILISPHCVISSFLFVNMWSIRVDVLGVTLAGDFINSLRPKVLQNSRYFLFWMIALLRFYFLLLTLNHSDISLYSDPLVYAILRLTYWASLNCLTVFLETLFDRKVCKQFQQYLVLFLE